MNPKLKWRLTAIVLALSWASGDSLRGEPAQDPAPAAEEAGELPDWWSAPVKRDPHTTLLARFDASGNVDADFERAGRGAAGRNYDAAVPGQRGGGVEIDAAGSQINFVGRDNMRPAQGTVQFWIRSKPGQNIWSDGKDHWFFSAAALEKTLELWKDSKNRLRLSWGGRPWEGGKLMGELLWPIQGLSGTDWHHLAFSWDSEGGRLWLSVDRKLRTLRVGQPLSVGAFHIFFLGASYYGGVGPEGLDPSAVFKTAGAIFDELKISDITIPGMLQLQKREKYLPDDVVLKTQDAARKHLSFLSTLQIDGAWSSILYAWPHLLPGETSYRTYFDPKLDHQVKVAHGNNGTPGAGQMFLYGYQVLGDRTYLEVAQRTGEWLLAAQQPEGYWADTYDSHTAGPPTPAGGIVVSHGRKVDHRDPTFIAARQSQAALFLAQLYLETREPKWLEGFRRSANFILKAQNPNGSWGHHFNLKTMRSENRNQDPYGAEFDNGTQMSQALVLLVAHHITKDRKYLDGIVKSGAWHMAAQLGPPTYGWAVAYDGENRPAWSRVYHPPAMSSGSSHSAASMLFFMYDLTGNSKYLAPVRKYIEAEKSAATKLRVDGQEIEVLGTLMDYKTGRPIAVDLQTWKIYYLDTAEERTAFLKTGTTQWKVTGDLDEGKFPWYPAYFRKGEWPELEAKLEKRLGGKRPAPERATEARLAESLASLRKEAEQIIAAQNEKGTWPILSRKVGAQGTYNIGAYIQLVDINAYTLLSVLERAKILSGEIDRTIWEFPSLIPSHLRGENWMEPAISKLAREN